MFLINLKRLENKIKKLYNRLLHPLVQRGGRLPFTVLLHMGVRWVSERGSAADSWVGIPPEDHSGAFQFGRAGSVVGGEDQGPVARIPQKRKVFLNKV